MSVDGRSWVLIYLTTHLFKTAISFYWLKKHVIFIMLFKCCHLMDIGQLSLKILLFYEVQIKPCWILMLPVSRGGFSFGVFNIKAETQSFCM